MRRGAAIRGRWSAESRTIVMRSTVSATSRHFTLERAYGARRNCRYPILALFWALLLASIAAACHKLGGIAGWVCVLLPQNFGASDKIAVNTCGQFARDLYRFSLARRRQPRCQTRSAACPENRTRVLLLQIRHGG